MQVGYNQVILSIQLVKTTWHGLCYAYVQILFEENYQTVVVQKIPGWSGFQSPRFSDPSTPTSIGYLLMIQADANEYRTVNMVMKLSLKMANVLGQS